MVLKLAASRGLGKVFCAAFVAASCTLVAQAETTETTEDKTVSGETWTVSVAAGDTNIVTAVQSGTGKIVKRGGGVLVLSAANTFSGGITLEEGFIFAHESNCLGTGLVTILGQRTGYAGPCELRFSACNKTFDEPNIHVTGQSTMQYPAIRLTCTNCVYKGNIAADQDLHLFEDSQWLYDAIVAKKGSAKWSVDIKPNGIMDFRGEVSAVGLLHLLPDGIYNFYGNVIAGEFETCLHGDRTYRKPNNDESQYYGALNFYGTGNRIGTLTFGNREVSFLEGSGVGGARIHPYVTTAARVLLESGDFVSAGLDAPTRTSKDNYANKEKMTVYGRSYLTSTLTVTGTTANAVLKSYVTIGEYLNGFTLDAANNPGFVQELCGRRHLTPGPITVRNGTLRLSGDSYFPHVTALSVEANGVLDIQTNDWPFADGAVALSLSSSARLVIANPEMTARVESLTVDGVRQMKGSWTHAALPCIPEGVVFEVASGSAPQPTKTVLWTGAAASDNLMTTMDNWVEEDGETVPASLDLAGGTLLVKLTAPSSSSEMIPDGTNRICKIVNEQPQAKEYGPFVIGAVGKCLYVDGSIVSDDKSQLVLRGTIGAILGDQGEAESKGPYTITYKQTARGSGQSPAGSIYGYTSNYGTPLVLDNAVVEKPVHVTPPSGGGEVFFAKNNTTNEFKGHLFVNPGGWHAFDVGAGAVVKLSGGCKETTGRPVKKSAGTLIIASPFDVQGGLNVEGGTVTLDYEGLAFGNTDSQNQGVRLGSASGASLAGKLEFLRSNCFADNDKEQISFADKNPGTIDFHCTTQRVSRFNSTASHSDSVLTGEYPAMLEIKGGTKWTTASYVFPTLANSVQVTGGLGFHYLGNGPASKGSKIDIAAGSEETFTLSGQAFESCGNLEVSGGTLALASGASWRNGTNFVARGTGTLKLCGSRQTNAKFAVLTLEGAGSKVEVAEGQTATFLACSVGGTPVEDGEYTAATLREGSPLKDRLTGSGTLRVGKFGLMLIVK